MALATPLFEKFRRLSTKVHQITSVDAGEIIVCNAVFRLSISCSVPEIFAIEVRSRPKTRQKKHVFRPQILLGEDPQVLDLVFKIAPKVSRRSAERPRRSRAEEKQKKEKKQHQNIRVARR